MMIQTVYLIAAGYRHRVLVVNKLDGQIHMTRQAEKVLTTTTHENSNPGAIEYELR